MPALYKKKVPVKPSPKSNYGLQISGMRCHLLLVTCLLVFLSAIALFFQLRPIDGNSLDPDLPVVVESAAFNILPEDPRILSQMHTCNGTSNHSWFDNCNGTDCNLPCNNSDSSLTTHQPTPGKTMAKPVSHWQAATVHGKARNLASGAHPGRRKQARKIAGGK